MNRHLVILLMLAIGHIFAAAQSDTLIMNGTLDDTMPFGVQLFDVEDDNSAVSLVAERTAGDVDTLLYLLDDAGMILAANDNRSPDDFDSALTYDAPAGTYQAVIARYNLARGRSSGGFRLEIAIDATAETEPELLADNFPEQQIADRRPWTMLLYLSGQTTDQSSLQALQTLIDVGDNEAAHVLALMKSTQGTLLYHLRPGRPLSEPLAELNTMGHNEEALLAQFTAWGLQNYPAERYALWLGGDAILPVDLTSQADYLGPDTVSRGIQAGLSQVEVESLDLLVAAASAMNSIDFHSTLVDHAQFAIATPAILGQESLSSSVLWEIVDGLPSDTITTAEVAEALAERYREMSGSYVAATDLSAFDDVVAAVNAFTEIVALDPARHHSVIGQARSQALTYTPLADDFFIDVGQFMTGVASRGDVGLSDAANDVLAALIAAILNAPPTPSADARRGYTIMFPIGVDQIGVASSPLSQWQMLLQDYTRRSIAQPWLLDADEIAFHPPQTTTVQVSRSTDDTSILNPALIDFEIVGSQLASDVLVVDRLFDNRTQRYLHTPAGDHDLTAGVVTRASKWDALLPHVGDGINRAPEFIRVTPLGHVLEGRYRASDSDVWTDAALLFDTSGSVQTIYSYAADHRSLTTVTLAPGTAFQAYEQVVSPDGRLRRLPGNIYIWSEDGLMLSEAPAPFGTYGVGLQVADLAGLTSQTNVTLVTANEGLSSNLRGDTDTFVGFTVPRPAAWSMLTRRSDEMIYRSTEPSGAGSVTIYFASNISDPNLEAVAEMLNEANALEATSALISNTVAGIPVLEYNYRSVDATGNTSTGNIFVSYNETIFAGMGVAVENADDPLLYEQVRAGTRLFDPLLYEEELARQWHDLNLGTSASYPMRLDWQTQREEASWTRYTPADDATGLTFIAVREAAVGLADGLRDATLDAEIDLIEERQYITDQLMWDVTIYTRESDGQAIIGRYYRATQQDRAYLIWMEAPTSAAAGYYADFFEPVVNGFHVTANDGV